VSELFYAMLDPNRDIRGTGIWLLEEKGIAVRLFEPELNQDLRKLNREFIDYELGLGIAINEPKISAKVTVSRFQLAGTFRTCPRDEDRVFVFNRSGDLFYPQSVPIWDKSAKTWTCTVAVGGPGEYELFVVSLSEDLDALRRYYNVVHREILAGTSAFESNDETVRRFKSEIERRAWVGMPGLNKNPGFKVLASVAVTRV
jgi:hypothetical protein